MNEHTIQVEGLSELPEFQQYARRKMAEDAEFWQREAEFGAGIFRVLACAVTEIGGGGTRDP